MSKTIILCKSLCIINIPRINTNNLAPGVVVSYTDDPEIQNGKKFLEQGLQIAAGVPLMCDEPEGFRTFRLGLFGLDKLNNIDRSVACLSDALDRIGDIP